MNIIKELTLQNLRLDIVEDEGRYFYRRNGEIILELFKNEVEGFLNDELDARLAMQKAEALDDAIQDDRRRKSRWEEMLRRDLVYPRLVLFLKTFMNILKETRIAGVTYDVVEDDGQYYYRADGEILATISKEEADAVALNMEKK
jgi:hypothetical protein